MPKEQPPRRVLHTPAHLQHILHDLLDGRVRYRHVDGANGDHQVETGDDVSGVSGVSAGSYSPSDERNMIGMIPDNAHCASYRVSSRRMQLIPSPMIKHALLDLIDAFCFPSLLRCLSTHSSRRDPKPPPPLAPTAPLRHSTPSNT